MLNKTQMAAAVVAKTVAADVFGGKKTYSLEVVTATDGAEYVFSVTFGAFSVVFTVIAGGGATLASIAAQIRSAVTNDTENDGPGGLSDFLEDGEAVGVFAAVRGTSPGVDFEVSTVDPKLVLSGPSVSVEAADQADAIEKFEPVAEAIIGDVLDTPITEDKDDYDPVGLAQATMLRIDGNGVVRQITGIVPYHRSLYVLNVGAADIVLVSGSVSSAPENRLNFANGDRTLIPFDVCHLIYDTISSRWRIVA